MNQKPVVRASEQDLPIVGEVFLCVCARVYAHMCACTESLPPFNLGLFAGFPIIFKAAFNPF